MSAARESSQKYILGLDLGSASIGWAVILLNQNEEPCKLQAAGAHIFDPGVEKPPAVGQMSQDELILRGLDRSKAAGRQIARQQRRQIDRRSLRVKKLFKLLQSNKLLPNCNDLDYTDLNSMTLADERFHLFMRLDKKLSDDLAKAHRKRGKGESVMLAADQALPYVLRKEALERKLTEWELGRALYHLCQRRGYRAGQAADDDDEPEADSTVAEATTKKSRKKKVAAEGEEEDKKEDNPKKVEASILDLHTKMAAAHAPTYGAYFANTAENDPHKQRIRHRWASRDKYIEEFKLIWDRQREFYHVSEADPAKEELRMRLSGLLDGDELRKQIYDCLFYQRPLASAAHLIGRCELIPDARRAPWATLEAQQFRLLQKVADLAYVPAGMDYEQRLNNNQQAILADALETRGDMTFAQIAELLGLPSDTYFNLPRDKKEQAKKKIIGNRINSLMLRIFGDRWMNELTEDQRHKAVNMWATSGDREARIEQASSQWNLQETAELWADEKPPKDYCKFSVAALRKLIDEMKKGIHWTTTAAEMRSHLAPREPLKFIPPVVKALPAITNPAVLRALTELRKVVNAIIREHGDRPPHEIRIELARELRKNRKQRHDTYEANEKNHKKRIEAAEKILNECKDYEYKSYPAERLVRERRDDVTKMLLLMECKCHCPYTGDPISYQKLFSGEVEVEHIIPASLMVDNDFNNLTLCYKSVNADKLNRTPWQAFGPHKGADRWAQIIDRVKKFENKTKLARFQMSSLDEVKAFASRRLNDTRYTSKLAGRLLMTLYADRDPESVSKDDPLDEFRDRSGRRPIKVSSGMVTHLLRDAWQLRLGNIIEDAFTCPDKASTKESSKKQPKRQPKDRCDHRHHAVDAVVIALTSDKIIHEINTLAGRLYNQYQRPLTYRDLRSVKSCWPHFIDDSFKKVFREMIISRRPEHKLSGPLHDETFYPKLRPDGTRHQRVSLEKFSKAKDEKAEMKLIGKIVDEDIKKAVVRFREKIGTFKKWNAERDGWPQLDRKRNGSSLILANIRDIKKVRIKINKPALDKKEPLGSSRSERHWRYVEEGDIAYVSFFSVQDRKGTKWEADIVKLFKAVQRVRQLRKADRGIEIISRTHSDPKYATATFRFSLMKGDLIRLLHHGKNGIFVVRRFESDGRFWVAPINAAGKDEDMKATGNLIRINSVSAFTKMWVDKDMPQPIFVDLLGNPHNIKVYA